MWNEDIKGLIEAIENLENGQVVPMGQCGFIFNLDGKRIGVDVIVSDLYYKGTDISRRRVVPPFCVDDCPKLDLLLVTHDHLDHLDRALASALAGKGTIISGPKHILDSLKIEECRKAYFENYGRMELGKVAIKAIPVRHMEYEDSEPGFSKYYGYLIQCNGKKLFHGGDTLSDERLISQAFGSDYLFLPINGRDKERLEKGIIGNMDIEEAIGFAESAKAGKLIPTHFDFFKENCADISAFMRRAEGRVDYTIPKPGEVFRLF